LAASAGASPNSRNPSRPSGQASGLSDFLCDSGRARTAALCTLHRDQT